jgi:hypothetical protein
MLCDIARKTVWSPPTFNARWRTLKHCARLLSSLYFMLNLPSARQKTDRRNVIFFYPFLYWTGESVWHEKLTPPGRGRQNGSGNLELGETWVRWLDESRHLLYRTAKWRKLWSACSLTASHAHFVLTRLIYYNRAVVKKKCSSSPGEEASNMRVVSWRGSTFTATLRNERNIRSCFSYSRPS